MSPGSTLIYVTGYNHVFVVLGQRMPSEILAKVQALLKKEVTHSGDLVASDSDPDYAQQVDVTVLGELINETYGDHGKTKSEVAQWLLNTIEDYEESESKESTGRPRGKAVTLRTFADFLDKRIKRLRETWNRIDRDSDATITLDDIYEYLEAHHFDYDRSKVAYVYSVFDQNKDGRISFEDFSRQLVLVPTYGSKEHERFFYRAYDFFIDDLEISADSDVLLSGESAHGLGYFWAGGFAGVVSRTATAPFDRLKVYLIANSTRQNALTLRQAVTRIYKSANPPGLRAFFVGNGLNIVKVFPESAVKFGGFESAKRLMAHIEGVDDTADLSKLSTFVAGGVGGMISQLLVYPIDTLKFRVQCAPSSGPGVIWRVFKQTSRDGGIRQFYRGLYVGVLGIFPFAALDLGLFQLLKRTITQSRARRAGIDDADVQLGNMAVLSMGALSGSVGATVVYPINLVRTRIQTQGTPDHPFSYNGFIDCWHQSIKREGWRGLFRGLGPNLAKVAPSVAISYVVYENTKRAMGLP